MFRNVRFYRLQSDWPETEAALSKELEKANFKPCGPLTERSSGWVPTLALLSRLQTFFLPVVSLTPAVVVSPVSTDPVV